MDNCLILNLTGPMMSFGLSRQAHRGPTDVMPTRSLITGLLGNALGYDNGRNATDLNRLQDRIRMAARLNHRLRPSNYLADYQSADIGFEQKGWTTHGIVTKRTSSPDSLKGSHIRIQHYVADCHVTVALRLRDAEDDPTVDQLGSALMEPERPLRIGRMNCIPSQYIFQATGEYESALAALLHTPLPDREDLPALIRTRWEPNEVAIEIEAEETYSAPGLIDWINHLEAGWLWWAEAHVPCIMFGSREPEAAS